MYLTFKDVAGLIADRRGAEEPDLLFCTVADQACVPQPKGLFLAFDEEAEKLDEAIANGAIAAVRAKGAVLPSCTPGPFPVFFSEDPSETVRKILAVYVEKLDGDKEKKMDTTRFHVLNEKIINKDNEIELLLKKINAHNENGGGRG